MSDRPDRNALADAAVQDWSRHLIGLGGPNNLLWASTGEPTEVDLARAHPGGLARLLSGAVVGLPELVREPSALASLTVRAEALHRRVDVLREQVGLLTCYLAMGTATWQQPGSTPRAPVILWRADIARDHGGRITLQLVGDLEVNPALTSYLRAQGIEVDDGEVLRASRSGDVFDLSHAFDIVERAATLPGFRIERSRVIDSFSYVKAANARDLTSQRAWIGTHDVVAALAGDHEAAQQVGAEPPPPQPVAVQDEFAPLDLDAEQQQVIAAVRAGAQLTVHAPSGCGTSQTIAGLVAGLAMDGRRALVVTQAWSDGDAVLDRLGQAGLGDLLLDVRSQTAAALTDRLRGQLADLAAAASEPAVAEPADLAGVVATLEQRWAAEHDLRAPWGVSPAQCRRALADMSGQEYVGSDRRLVIDDLVAVSVERLYTLSDALQAAVEAGAWSGGSTNDPWFGARVVGADHRQRTAQLVADLADGGLDAERATITALSDEVGLARPRSLREAQDQLDLMAGVFQTLEVFTPEVFGAGLPEMVAGTAEGADAPTDLGMFERRRLRSQAKRLLRPGASAHSLHGVLQRALKQRTRWQALAGKGSVPTAPLRTPQVATQVESLRGRLEWLEARLAGSASARSLVDTDFDEIQVLTERLRDADDRLAIVPEVIGTLDLLRANGFGDLLDDLAARDASPEEAAWQVRWVWWSSVLGHSQRTDPVLAAHDPEAARATEQDFRADDAAHVRAGAAAVRERVRRQVERVRVDLPDQVVTLRSRVLHPGALLTQAPELLTALRPAWLVSPLAVAATLATGLWFDVVIFDDGGQVPLPEALPAITRAGQVVVFGDRTQEVVLPRALQSPPAPSVFQALEPLAPQLALAHDYRSLDERLSAFAAVRRYGGEVTGFPAAGASTPIGMTTVHEDRIVSAALSAIREAASADPDGTLLVVTWTADLAQRIQTDLVRRVDDPDIRRRLGGAERTLVIGDVVTTRAVTADTAIVVLADERGGAALLQAMGAEGAMVRFWSAVSRARRRVQVLSTLDPQTFPEDRLRTTGSRTLRDYLRYCAAGGDPQSLQVQSLEQSTPRRRRRTASTGSVLDTPVLPVVASNDVPVLIDALAAQLRSRGLTAIPSYGVSGRPVELAVGGADVKLLLAVESDDSDHGEPLRFRLRLRPDQLAIRGWHTETVYAQDLQQDLAGEADRLAQVLRSL
ncbi:hypothetical protein ATK17_2548 [Branchiibius hedensis]|uniref:Part of AAA domain-containing protein n=1 Tax=Branchiibius hedensis TaxID=672460 RepID=A0A2Y8ZY35_9MICO|nr:hypothetical protein [Branchiibius hedensis]PWJ26387.1 hypothetical protein ATK17_2548 [Branchiibius hedensis]SSA35199.1 hypothetical protein SAMN04489750_2548 [Branchiibius hedensis]